MTARTLAPSTLKRELSGEDPVVLALAELINGATLLKAVRNGRPHFRDFCLSKDLKTVQWNTGNRKGRGVPVSSITEVVHGQKSSTFKDTAVPGYENMSFSIMYDKRSLDIVCKDIREYETWTRGLEALIGGYQDADAVMAVFKRHNFDSRIKVAIDAQGQAKPVQQGESCDVYTWGCGAGGVLGHGDEDDEKAPRVLEAVLGRSIRQLSLAGKHSIALEVCGEVYTWGNGLYGRLGHGNLHSRFLPLRVGDPLEDTDVVYIGSNTYHSAAVLDDGSVYTWGQSSNPQFGRLGYACARRSTMPTLVEGLKDHFVVMVACGINHTIVLTEKSTVYAFGENNVGQLGCGDGEFHSVVKVVLDVPIVKIAAGAHHSAALTSDGQLYLWGSDQHGQCAMGGSKIILTPQKVASSEPIEDVACGGGHTLAVGATGGLYAFGDNSDGQLGMGDPTKKPEYALFNSVPCNAKFVKVAAGPRSSAGVTDSGRLHTWGFGESGSLGHGDLKPRYTPQEVTSLTDKIVRSVYIGANHMAALVLNSWVADDEAKLCMSCKLKFTAVRRRHHCRQCGGVFCSACTTKRYPLLDKGFSDPVRVCDRCYALLTKKGMLSQVTP